LTVDFGKTIGIRKSSAQITKRYSKEDLINRQIVAVVNFPKKQIGTFMSECLVLGAVGEEGDVILLAPDFKIQNGLRIG
jgi:tRNA-binding protein